MKSKSKLGEVRANDAAKVAAATASLLAQLNDRLDRANELAEKQLKVTTDVAKASVQNNIQEAKTQKTNDDLLNQHQKEYRLSLELRKQKAEELKQAKQNQRAMTGKIAGSTGVGITTFGDRVQGFKDTFKGMRSNTGSTIGKMLGVGKDSMIGSVLAQRDSVKQYIKDTRANDPEAKALSDKELKQRHNTLQKLGKQKVGHEAEISRLQAAGFNTENSQAAKALAKTEQAMIDTGDVRFKNKATEEEKAREQAKGQTTGIQKLAEAEATISGGAAEEKQDEANALVEEQTGVLKKILQALGGRSEPTNKTEPTSKAGSGLLDSIFGFLSSGILMSIKSLFSPKMILKAIGKVFVPAMIIGSLFSGIMDGWEEFKKSGSIIEALKAGFGGILDFLTFGLIDKDSIAKFTDWISKPVGEFVDKIGDIFSGIGDFFTGIKDSFLNLISNIGIPEFEIDLPIIGKKKFGPYFPFKDNTSNTSIEQNASAGGVTTAATTAAIGATTGKVQPISKANIKSDPKALSIAPDAIEATAGKVQPISKANIESDPKALSIAPDANMLETNSKYELRKKYEAEKISIVTPLQNATAVDNRSNEVEAAKEAPRSTPGNNVAVVNSNPTTINNNTIATRKDVIKGDRSSSSVGKNPPGPPR